jgi:NADPH:quinone reductase-like Zn-dependent oxidoreductase
VWLIPRLHHTHASSGRNYPKDAVGYVVSRIGADHVIDYNRADFADGQRHYDLILDIGGNSRLSRLRRALTPRGTLVIAGGEGPGGPGSGGSSASCRHHRLSRP